MQQSNVNSLTFSLLGTDGIFCFHHPVIISSYSSLKSKDCMWFPINLYIHGKPHAVQNYLTEYDGTYNNYPIQVLTTIQNGFLNASTVSSSFITYKIKLEIIYLQKFRRRGRKDVEEKVVGKLIK